MLTPSERDRIMSLHRRAYACKDFEAWCDLAKQLDCPVDAVDQFWKTAQTAKDAGMDPKQAFPLSGEHTRHLGRDCLPGDLVWWRTVAGVVTNGELVEWDNGTAIVRNVDGEHPVRAE